MYDFNHFCRSANCGYVNLCVLSPNLHVGFTDMQSLHEYETSLLVVLLEGSIFVLGHSVY